MMTHPDRVIVLANARHRELLDDAEQHRVVRLAAPSRECRTPTVLPATPCRPEVRRSARQASGLLRRRRFHTAR